MKVKPSCVGWFCVPVSIFLVGVLAGCDKEPQQWQTAKTANTVSAYEGFLKHYPRGPFSGEAQTRIVGLRLREAEMTDTPESYRSFLSESSLAVWLRGDFVQAIQWAQEQAKIQPEATLPRYLVSLGLYFQGDYASLQEHRDSLLSREDNCARLLRWCDALLEKGPPSARAHFARACILDHMKRGKDAAEAYQRAVSTDPNCAAYRNCLEVVQNQLDNAQYSSQFQASVSGELQPVDGVYGNFLPVDGKTVIRGTVECSYGHIRTTAAIDGSSRLYQDREQTQVIGWGANLTSGWLLLPAATYAGTRRKDSPYVPKDVFAVKPLDYLGKYVEIVPTSTSAIGVVPLQIHTPEERKIGDPGSVMYMSPQCTDPAYGIPASVEIAEGGIRMHFEGRLCLLAAGVRTGMVLSEKRYIFGGGNMRFLLSSGTINGSLEAALALTQ